MNHCKNTEIHITNRHCINKLKSKICVLFDFVRISVILITLGILQQVNTTLYKTTAKDIKDLQLPMLITNINNKKLKGNDKCIRIIFRVLVFYMAISMKNPKKTVTHNQRYFYLN